MGSTQPPDSATSGNVNLTLVVQAEGIAATSVEHSCLAPTKKWPFPGETLPVTFDRSDPTKLKVRWDDVPEAGDVAKQQAEALAAQLNQGGPQLSGTGGVDDDGRGAAAGDARRADQRQGADAAGLGAAAPAPADDDDRVAQLERLAKLKETGALTEQEFEREKARILGS